MFGMAAILYERYFSPEMYDIDKRRKHLATLRKKVQAKVKVRWGGIKSKHGRYVWIFTSSGSRISIVNMPVPPIEQYWQDVFFSFFYSKTQAALNLKKGKGKNK